MSIPLPNKFHFSGAIRRTVQLCSGSSCSRRWDEKILSSSKHQSITNRYSWAFVHWNPQENWCVEKMCYSTWWNESTYTSTTVMCFSHVRFHFLLWVALHLTAASFHTDNRIWATSQLTSRISHLASHIVLFHLRLLLLYIFYSILGIDYHPDFLE